ncbi:MAG: DUF4191 domain-containing protein [Ruaniaceae bacterium]|nr:DUF4191 domain-containing protein [Ruaniaceae bacterium]
MVEEKEPKKAKKPKKRRWYHNFADAFVMVWKAELGWGIAILGAVLAGTAAGVGIGLYFGQGIYGGFVGFLTGLVIGMFVLTWRVRKVSYSQIDGRPGASIAVLDQIKRGWNINQEPVQINPRSQDLVFRMVGKPGIVLVSEGPTHRVQRLLVDEKRKVQRVAPKVPVTFVNVGNDEGQVSLLKLQRHIKRLPKHLSAAEVHAVSNRLNSLGGAALPIPKGIDPMRARPDRKGQRGR